MTPIAKATLQSAAENLSCMRNYAARILEQLHLVQLSPYPDGYNDLLDDVASLVNDISRLQERLSQITSNSTAETTHQ